MLCNLLLLASLQGPASQPPNRATAQPPDSTTVILLGTGMPVPDPQTQGPATAVTVGSRLFVFDAGPGVDAGPPSPTATINHPADGETRPPSVPFVGVGMDVEDGALTGASLVWTSDVDGMLGTGAMLTATLTPGPNVVTLTATDSMGNTGTDTVTLTITP